MLFLSLVNHSCAPNCKVEEQYAVDEETPPPEYPDYYLVAINEILPGQDISISYLDVEHEVLLSADRRRRLEEGYLFRCTCFQCGTWTDCGDEGTSPRCEDYLCGRQLPGDTEVLICGGRVDSRTGECFSCRFVLSAKDLDKREDKAIKLIKRARVVVGRNNQSIAELQDMLQDEEEANEEERSDIKGTIRFMRRKESCIDELERCLPELEQLKSKLEGILYCYVKEPGHCHVVFRPISKCLEASRAVLLNYPKLPDAKLARVGNAVL